MINLHKLFLHFCLQFQLQNIFFGIWSLLCQLFYFWAISITLYINLSLKIKNTGDAKGKEIIQVYISKINSKIERPKKELKGFSKTKLLNVAESSILDIEIPLSDFSYWNEETNNWSIENGEYNILIGSSSRDIKLEEKIKI